MDGSYFSLLNSQENQRSEICCFSYLMRQTQVWKDVQTQRICYSSYLNIFWFFKIFQLHPENFWLKSCELDWFKCKPLPPKCQTSILLLFILSIFNWQRCFVSWLTVIFALASSVRNAGVDMKTLQWVKSISLELSTSKDCSRLFVIVNSWHHFSQRVK